MQLEKMASDLGDSKVVKEFNHERLKRAFSIVVVEFLDQDQSATAAEHRARACKSYGTQIADLSEQLKSALRIIEQYDALKTKFDSARSILAAERSKLEMI